jgi:NAD(P)H dehydrogenase (quinone)
VIAVTGASGGIGGRVARRLADAGLGQVLVVRDPARAPQIAGSTVRTATYDDPAALAAAFDGLEAVFLVSAAEHRQRVRQHRTAIDAAVAAGVRRVVYTSFTAAAPEATFTFARDHLATEQYLRTTGLATTVLRDNLYADFLPGMAGADGVIRGPAGDGVVAAVARDDVADVAARVLREPGRHDGQTYDLTGPRAFSLFEAAEVLTEVTGRPVRYEPETVQEAYASRAGAGEDFEIAGWVSSYEAIAAGELSVVSEAVAEVTGSPAMPFRDVLRRYPEGWAHLTHR